MINQSLFQLALPSLRQEFQGYSDMANVADDYGLDGIVCGYFLVLQSDHPQFDQRVSNLEMDLGGSNFLYNLPPDGHSFTSDNCQDRLFLFDCDVSKEEIEGILGSVLSYLELVDVSRLIN